VPVAAVELQQQDGCDGTLSLAGYGFQLPLIAPRLSGKCQKIARQKRPSCSKVYHGADGRDAELARNLFEFSSRFFRTKKISGRVYEDVTKIESQPNLRAANIGISIERQPRGFIPADCPPMRVADSR
jgi:hypothetical protein